MFQRVETGASKLRIESLPARRVVRRTESSTVFGGQVRKKAKALSEKGGEMNRNETNGPWSEANNASGFSQFLRAHSRVRKSEPQIIVHQEEAGEFVRKIKIQIPLGIKPHTA